MPLRWWRLSNMRPVLELVDLPLPNHPVARRRLTARLLLFEKRLSSLCWLPLLLWPVPLVGPPLPVTEGFERSRRHRNRPSIRSIKLDVVNVINSSLLLLALLLFWGPASMSPALLTLLLLLLFSPAALTSNSPLAGSLSSVALAVVAADPLLFAVMVDPTCLAGSAGGGLRVTLVLPSPTADALRELAFSSGDA